MARRRQGRAVHGWVVLDKPAGMTSTQAVAVVRRLFQARKAGHAGTLDPLATGILPIALGEATKTVPFAVEGRKRYRFKVRWGVATDTDDAEGREMARSEARPARADIEARLPAFTGEILQTPPAFSAIKVDGERAYDLARAGRAIELQARPVLIQTLELIAVPDADHAVFEAECGKGTYVRAIARDLGRVLGCLGHLTELRRLAVGPFQAGCEVTLETLQEASARGSDALDRLLVPIEAALSGLPRVDMTAADAARLLNGQPVLLRGRDAPVRAGIAYVASKGAPIAVARLEKGELHPIRVFNFSEAR